MVRTFLCSERDIKVRISRSRAQSKQNCLCFHRLFALTPFSPSFLLFRSRFLRCFSFVKIAFFSRLSHSSLCLQRLILESKSGKTDGPDDSHAQGEELLEHVEDVGVQVLREEQRLQGGRVLLNLLVVLEKKTFGSLKL